MFLVSCVGTLSPAASCDVATLKVFGKIFDSKCGENVVNTFPVEEDGVKKTKCVGESPYGYDLEYHDRVFVVSQADDSHIYHVQIGIFLLIY